MSIFAQEGKLARFLNRLGDLIWLNVLTMVFCIPVVTAGAAVTARYLCGWLKMRRVKSAHLFYRDLKRISGSLR